MKFLDWLLGGDQRPAPTPLFGEPEPDLRKYTPVPKWTHPGKKGKTVYCPRCLHGTHVGHFAWSALRCSQCKASAGKYEWLLRADEER
jgi:hypothetical protein